MFVLFLLLFHQQRTSVQIRGFSGGSVVKNLTANTGDARDASWISGLIFTDTVPASNTLYQLGLDPGTQLSL